MQASLVVVDSREGMQMASAGANQSRLSETAEDLSISIHRSPKTEAESFNGETLSKTGSGRGANLRLHLQTLHHGADEDQLMDNHHYILFISGFACLLVAGSQIFCYNHWHEDDSNLDVPLMKSFGSPTGISERTFTLTQTFRPIDILRYCTIFQWITCVLCGLGGEVVFGQFMVKHLSDEGGKAMYLMAQLFFSLCLSVAFFANSSFGMPFLVVGMWKAGFPETLGYFSRARDLGFGKGRPSLECIVAFFNGMGTLLHHASAAFLICAVNTRLCPLNRDTVVASLPIIMQHWFCMSRYVLPTWAYALIQAILEIEFEWELLVVIPHFSPANGVDRSIRGASGCMLVAHWFYWSAAILSAFTGNEDKDLLSFHHIDIDGSGSLDFDEFCAAIKRLGMDMTPDELSNVFTEIDSDASGTVTVDEFQQWMKSQDIKQATGDLEVIEWRQMARRNRPTKSKRIG